MMGISIWDITKKTIISWSKDNASIWCGALSYFTIFSIGPLLLLVISIIAIFLSKSTVESNIYSQINGFIGPSSSNLIEDMVKSTQSSSSGIIGTIIGIITLFFGATGVFNQLKQMLNHIWEVKQKPGIGLKGTIFNQATSFAMVAVIGFLLLVSLIASAVVAAISKFFAGIFPIPVPIVSVVDYLLSFLLSVLLFGLLFKVLPDVETKWRDIWIGSVITSILFSLGKAAIAWYISHSHVAVTYGVAASVIIILLWAYYISQIVFIGAEFTKEYSLERNGEITPSKYGIREDIEISRSRKNKKSNFFLTYVRGIVEGFSGELVKPEHRKKKK